MADASTWADDARNVEKTGGWHYIDIPLALTRNEGEVSEWCAPVGAAESGKGRAGCITDALTYELNILRDNRGSGADRAKALRYVIHFVGDIHQPLHSEDNDDRGGNCTAMTFFTEERPANLHAIWDYKLIEHELAAAHWTTTQFAAALDARFTPRRNEWTQAKADAVAWAWESHALARSVVYGDLTPRVSIEQPNARVDCSEMRERVAGERILIGAGYYDQARPVIDQQLAKAGYRLAALLNATFAE